MQLRHRADDMVGAGTRRVIDGQKVLVMFDTCCRFSNLASLAKAALEILQYANPNRAFDGTLHENN